MRSAKRKLITPPKLMPPCQSAAAIGTLPTEHTKLMNAMKGPTIDVLQAGPEPVAGPEDVVPHIHRHEHGEEAGDAVTDDELPAKHLDVGDRVARGIGPCAGRRELLAPGSTFDRQRVVVVPAVRRVRTGSDPLTSTVHQAAFEHVATEGDEQHDHDRAADELGRGELPPHEDEEHDRRARARGSSRRT